MKLFNLLTPGTTLLTPNRRLSAALTVQFQEYQVKQNKSCWQTPDILPLQSWLQRTWQELAAKNLSEKNYYLLSSHQEMILWEEILAKMPEHDYLLQISATAELAKSAWGLLKQWRIDVHDPILSQTEDSKTFQKWAREISKVYTQNHWLDASSLADVIEHSILQNEIQLPSEIILFGFTEITPQQNHLLSAYENAGTRITHYKSERSADTVSKISLIDEDAEIRTMAGWAKSIYQSSQRDLRAYSIGCVIPNLEKLRDTALKIFSDVFSENHTFTLDPTLLPFNISAGKSLASYPIIHTALALLGLSDKPITIEIFSNLLRSPFLGHAEQEQLKRAYFDGRLRNANVTTVKLEKLLHPNDPAKLTASCPALARRLTRYLAHLTNIKKSLPLSAWAKHFIELLTLLGWPGERSLNSQEYQVTQRWLEILTEFSTYDSILPSQSFSAALNYLTQITTKTIFQIQTPEAPIQIVGVLEAVELPFEHLWVMGLDDSQWPGAPKPNPFIPQQLQKKLHMPHATAERELIYCTELTEQLKNSAKHVIFSHALKNDDADLRPSSLLQKIVETNIEAIQIKLSDSPAKVILSEQQLDTLIDNLAPEITDHAAIRGGINIFKLQAACPFKAFAELRLHARKLETPTIGLRALDRGIIAHKALELIWLEIKNSETLNSLDPNELTSIIHHSAEQAIEATTGEKITSQRYLTLELRRLEKLLSQWLEIEKQRPAFKVLFQEYEKNTSMGQIPLTLRVDRIDQLEDGTQIIIDYKTGKHNEISGWFGERPDEPQLPLYCVTEADNTVGIAFAKINPDKIELIGVSKLHLGIDSIKMLTEVSAAEIKIWSQQLENWHSTLAKLGTDFCHGVADVDPKNKQETCRHCNLHALCRTYENQA